MILIGKIIAAVIAADLIRGFGIALLMRRKAKKQRSEQSALRDKLAQAYEQMQQEQDEPQPSQ